MQPQVITHRGYPVEIHHVTTEDGFGISKQIDLVYVLTIM